MWYVVRYDRQMSFGIATFTVLESYYTVDSAMEKVNELNRAGYPAWTEVCFRDETPYRLESV